MNDWIFWGPFFKPRGDKNCWGKLLFSFRSSPALKAFLLTHVLLGRNAFPLQVSFPWFISPSERSRIDRIHTKWLLPYPQMVPFQSGSLCLMPGDSSARRSLVILWKRISRSYLRVGLCMTDLQMIMPNNSDCFDAPEASGLPKGWQHPASYFGTGIQDTVLVLGSTEDTLESASQVSRSVVAPFKTWSEMGQVHRRV